MKTLLNVLGYVLRLTLTGGFLTLFAWGTWETYHMGDVYVLNLLAVACTAIMGWVMYMTLKDGWEWLSEIKITVEIK